MKTGNDNSGDVPESFSNRCMVAPTNEAAKEVNDLMLMKLSKDTFKEFLSFDSICGGDANGEHYPEEFLNPIETGGLPPHKLCLCEGAVLMVIRNYAPHLGVCNGTRVRVLNIGRRLLHVVILTGPKRGHEVYLPRFCCDAAEDTDLPFALRRYQVPVRLAWAMTINKSQGQTFGERIGIYLHKPVFAHGQLYCAMSRATRAEHVRIWAKEFEQDQRIETDDDGNRCLRTLNIVNRVFLHGTQSTPITTSLAPSSRESTKGKPPAKKRCTQQCDDDDDGRWEREAGNVSVPDAGKEDDKPPTLPDKCDVAADAAEEMPRPEATPKQTQEEETATELKEVADGNMADDELQWECRHPLQARRDEPSAARTRLCKSAV